jgi:hypothetical protein
MFCVRWAAVFFATGSIVQWTVPVSGSYTILAKGAQGCATTGYVGGMGASMQGVFWFTAGQVLSILVGEQPVASSSFPGGGGGSFVALGSSFTTATPLLVAGGGGGVYSGTAPTACGGQISQLGSGISAYQFGPGHGSFPAPCCGGGGGFYSSGGTDTRYSFPGGQGFQQGGAGAIPPSSYANFYTNGGFGGGGIADFVSACNSRGGPGGNMNKSFVYSFLNKKPFSCF